MTDAPLPTRYAAFGRVIASDVPLPLHLADSDRVDLRVRRARPGGQPPAAGWIDVRSEIGVASISPAGDHVELDLSPAASRSETESFVLGMVMLQVLSLRTTLCLHGGGTLGPEGAIGLVAPSGAGKSTLVASLMKRGHALLADDMLPLAVSEGRMSAVPTYATLRLWDRSLRFLDLGPEIGEPAPGYDRKFVLSDVRCLGRFHGQVAPLHRLYFLRQGEAAANGPLPRLERLRPLTAFQELVANRLCPQVETPETRRQAFDLLAAVSRDIPCYALWSSRSASALPATVEAVLDPEGLLADLEAAGAGRPA